jgi:exopolysaccharide production protein ExoZ
LIANRGVSTRKTASFQGIQALRGFAATLVVVFHATLIWWLLVGGNDLKSIPPPWWPGASAVDLFFVISGFVMAVSTFGKENDPGAARTFLERRAIRLFPMYWILTAVFAVQLYLENHYTAFSIPGLPAAHLTPGFFLGSLTLVPFFHEGSKDPIAAVGWTLSFEILFYLLFAIALYLRMKPLRFLLPTIVLLVIVGHFHKQGRPAFTLLADPLLLEFLGGVVVGEAINRGLRLRKQWGLLMMLVGFCTLLLPQIQLPAHRCLMWGIPAMLIVMGAASIEYEIASLWPKWILLLGDASYSLYLLHGLSLYIAAKAFVNFVQYGVVRRTDELLMVLFCLALSMPASLWLYKTVEKPLTNSLRRKLLGAGKPQSQKHQASS